MSEVENVHTHVQDKGILCGVHVYKSGEIDVAIYSAYVTARECNAESRPLLLVSSPNKTRTAT